MLKWRLGIFRAMKHGAFLGFLFILAACGTPAKPVSRSTGAGPRIQQQIESGILPAVEVAGEDVQHFTLAERMAKHKVPGVSIAVFDNYRLVWAGAYGVVDIETTEPVTETTLFQAGSISKSVNALAVLLTAADGAFELDAPINNYLKSWKLPDNELTTASPVTLRRLLSHTAGTTVHGFPGYPTGATLPTLVQVLDGVPPSNTPAVRVDLTPGAKFRYSGGGTTITQLLLVETLAMPYPAIQAQRVLGPLGMNHSTYEQPLPADRVSHAASGHHPDETVVATKRHVYPEMAAAGLWTTPTDLARFFTEIALARANRSTHVTHAIAMQMTSEVAPKAQVGLGVFLSTRNGEAMFGHNGADEGFQAYASASLDRGFGLVVMANSDNGFQIFPEIERTVFAAMNWPGANSPITRVALSAAQRDRWIATFTDAEGLPLSISASGDGLIALRPFGAPDPLVAVSADRVIMSSGVRLTLTADGIQLANGDEPFGSSKRIAASVRLPLLELDAGRYDDAVTAWKELLRADPNSQLASEAVHNLYGYELLKEGKVAPAIEIFRAIVAVFPESSNAYDSLGEACVAAGDQSAAIAAYEAAIAKLDLDPRIPAEEKPSRRSHAEEVLVKLRAP